MQFLDRTLLRLTDDTERSAILSPAVGDRLLTAAFLFDNAEVGAVTGVSVREIEVLPAVAERQHFDAAVIYPLTGARWEAAGSFGALFPHAAADARIEVLLTTEMRVSTTSIESMTSESLEDLADLELVDARIVTDDGALPSDPDLLAERRFTALKALLHERFVHPEEFDVDNFFDIKGIDTVDELLAYLSPPRHPQRLALDIVTDGTLPSTIANQRVLAAIHIEEDPVARLHAVIDEIQTSRALMGVSTEAAMPPSGMSLRTGYPFVLIFGEAALDDPDLPLPSGSTPVTEAALREARLQELQDRLRPFGIALAPIPN